ncbi:hypothetical protein DQ244_18500 [Blastococcus sp. TBT05-19]|uniref:FUSC family protein n=1 Tax=Blastococcus sp. TBT05-19 TaxID=2250581 RepID=UPI000DE885C6|nr:hypothetical protein [Blastococcus sp. TBT05-19]RBY86671.1 hypothetical protein DQ244_18500 [Blastococcus sp. TBT05-19]
MTGSPRLPVGAARVWIARGRRAWYRNPRWLLTVRTAAAAAVAWALAQLLPSPLQDYSYYAPLGAVVTSSITLAGSARESVRVLLAILGGAVIGVVVDWLEAPGLLAIALVVALGTLAGGWRRLGAAGSWVPTSALFVLVLGQQDTGGYVLAYAGLVLLGAVVGLAMTALLPPLALTPADEEVTRLRETLAVQLTALAEGLRQQHPPTRDEWRARSHAIDPVLVQMRTAVQQADDARRGNRRVRKYQQQADRLYAQARALESLAFLVEDLTELIAETEVAEHQKVALGPSLRPAAAEALDRLADVLRTIDGAAADAGTTRDAYAALHRLTGDLREARRGSDDDLFTASSIAEAIRRCLAAVVPEELARQDDRDRGTS